MRLLKTNVDTLMLAPRAIPIGIRNILATVDSRTLVEGQHSGHSVKGCMHDYEGGAKEIRTAHQNVPGPWLRRL